MDRRRHPEVPEAVLSLNNRSKRSIAPSLPFQGDQAVDAHVARAPAPPTQGGGSGQMKPALKEDREGKGIAASAGAG